MVAHIAKDEEYSCIYLTSCFHVDFDCIVNYILTVDCTYILDSNLVL
jgi:hypothetical protein